MMRFLKLYIIILLSTSYIYSQDTRDALPISLREKASLKYQGKKLSAESSEQLVKHMNKLSDMYEEGENYRDFFKRGLNVARNIVPSQAIGVKVVSELAFETADWALDQQSKQYLDGFNHNLDNLAKAVITMNQDLEINSEQFRNEIEALFFEGNIRPENYPVLGRQFDKMIFDRLVENIEDLNNFKADVGNRIIVLEHQGKSRDEAIREIYNNLSENNEVIASLESSQASMRKDFAQLELNIDQKINVFIANVVDWQEQVYDDIGFIEKKVKDTETKIQNNTQKITDLQKRLNGNTLSIEKQGQKLKELQSLQFKNRNMILSNRARIDGMGVVLYGEASTSGKIEMLKKGLIQFEDANAQQEEVEKLKNLQSWEDFNRDLAMGREVVQFASNLGLDESIVSDANKAIGTLSLVGQFAMSYPSNPMGMISSINGAFALFGGEGQGKPNPAIMAELAAIKRSLSEINKKIDALNEKTDSLLARQYEFHIENMRQFSLLHREIQELEIKTDYMMQLISNKCSVLDPDEYSVIDIIKGRLSVNSITLDNYNQLLMSFPNILPLILNCIDKNTQSLNLSTMEFTHMNRISLEVVKSQYNRCLTYATSIYNKTLLMDGLNYFPIYTNSLWQLVNQGKNTPITYEQAFNQMINPEDLTQLIDLYLLVMPYFLLEEDHNTAKYQIWSESDISTIPELPIIDRTNTQLRKLKRLFKLIDFAIMQQSLLSGNKLFQHLSYDLGKSSSLRKSIAFQAIENNPLMQLNLATYLVNENMLIDSASEFAFADFVNRAYDQEINDDVLKSWSQKLKNNWSIVQKKDNLGYSLFIMSSVQVNGKNKNLYLPIDLQSVLTNEVVYSNAALEILNIKEKVKSKLYEYELQSILNANSNSTFTQEFNNLYH